MPAPRFNEMEVRSSAETALGNLQRFDNATEKIEAGHALRDAVKVLLSNQMMIAMALAQIIAHLKDQDR